MPWCGTWVGQKPGRKRGTIYGLLSKTGSRMTPGISPKYHDFAQRRGSEMNIGHSC